MVIFLSSFSKYSRKNNNGMITSMIASAVYASWALETTKQTNATKATSCGKRREGMSGHPGLLPAAGRAPSSPAASSARGAPQVPGSLRGPSRPLPTMRPSFRAPRGERGKPASTATMAQGPRRALPCRDPPGGDPNGPAPPRTAPNRPAPPRWAPGSGGGAGGGGDGRCGG